MPRIHEGSAGHSSFLFPTPLASETLRIHFDASNQGGESDDVGLDNVRFAQQGAAAVVPEPATLLLVASGLAAAGFVRRRRPGAARPDSV